MFALWWRERGGEGKGQVIDLSIYEPLFWVLGPQVTVYNRPSGSYGRDRYLLTNQAGNPAAFWGIDVNIRASTDRFMVLAGGTVWTRTVAPAAAVGFLPTENDQSVLGNLFVDPNAATSARGQVFPDRSHTVKVAGVYRLPWRVRIGAIARYQDGQPFARLVIVPDLTQGSTAVRSYVNGGTAFTYTGTLDIRVQKSFTAGRTDVTACWMCTICRISRMRLRSTWSAGRGFGNRPRCNRRAPRWWACA
jgi:hypothetical protein